MVVGVGWVTGWATPAFADDASPVSVGGAAAVSVEDGTPPRSSAHARQLGEMLPPPAKPSQDQLEAAELDARGLLFPKPASDALDVSTGAPDAVVASPRTSSAKPAVGPDFINFGYMQSDAQVFHTRWQALTHIGSLFVSFNANGDLVNPGTFTNRSGYLKAGGAAQAAGVKMVLVVNNQNFDVTTILTPVMTDVTKRQNLATQVRDLVVNDGYCAGVSFDFEFSWGTATRNGITQFLIYMRSILPADKEISIYTHPIYSSTYWDIANVEPTIDYLLYSTYDWASGNTAHAISDFNSCVPNIVDYFDAGLPPSKMVLVWAAYSRRWTGITSYNATGSSPSSRGFTDGLYDTTFNPTYGGPYTSNYVTGDEIGWYTYNSGTADYVATWDTPESLEYKIRASQVFPGSSGAWAGVRLRGVGWWSLMWMAESASGASYNGNASDPPTGYVDRTRTYPHIYQLCEEILSPPGTSRFVFEGFEGLDPRWRGPVASPDAVGDTNGDSARGIVAAPAGAGRPASTTNAMRVTFDFEGTGTNRAFFRHEVLASSIEPTIIDTHATAAHFDATTKLSAYIQTPTAYPTYNVRMVVMDKDRQLEMSNPFSLNASGWRQIEWDLTNPSQVHGYATAEWAFNDGNGAIATAGGGARDVSFIGFLIEGTGATNNASVVFDELAYEHADAGGKHYTINEFRYSDPATEFVEIHGPAGAFPSGFQLRIFDSSNGSARTVSLGGKTIPNDGGGFGFFVVGEPGMANVDESTGFDPALDDIPNVSPSALQLYDTATGCVYDSVTYLAYSGLAQLTRQQTLGVTAEGYPWVGAVSSGTTAAGDGYSAGRYPDGADTQWNARDIAVMPPSPGAPNGGSVSLPATFDFATAPPRSLQTYQYPRVENPVTAGLPASPGGGNASRSVDTTGGGVMAYFGDAALGADGAGYRATGRLYIPAASEPAQAVAVGLCGRQGSTFFTGTPAASGYESGYMLIYESAAGVGLNDGRADHPGTFEFVHATNDNMDNAPVALLGSASLAATGATAGSWAPFELLIDPTAVAGEQLVAKINGHVVFAGPIPEGGPTAGAFQVGFRENHTGAPAANEGTWIDDLRLSPVKEAAFSGRFLIIY